MIRIDPKTLKWQNMSCCTEQLATASLTDWHNSPWPPVTRRGEFWQHTATQLSGKTSIFTPKPQFWFPNTQIRPQSLSKCLWTLKGNQNHIKLEIKTSFHHKSSIHPFFIKLSKTIQFTLQLHDYEYPWYQSSTTKSHNNNNIN
jgi:hypothetical protein